MIQRAPFLDGFAQLQVLKLRLALGFSCGLISLFRGVKALRPDRPLRNQSWDQDCVGCMSWMLDCRSAYQPLQSKKGTEHQQVAFLLCAVNELLFHTVSKKLFHW